VAVPTVYELGASFKVELTEQLSPTVGDPNGGLAVQIVPLAVTTTSEGQVLVGLILSSTVTSNVQLAELLLASVTVRVTV
jgi:hypothetical protein